MKRKEIRYLVSFVIFFLAACVTVNIYFPAAQVQKAAEDIVKEVRGSENRGKEIKPEKPTSWLGFESNAYAANELTVSNATIRQLKDRMKNRFPLLSPFMSKGIVGEGANGLLVIKNLAGLNLRDKATVQRLVTAENSDRMALYKAVASSLNIPLSELSRVQAIFAKKWQESAPSGTFIEKTPGNWVRK